MPATIVQAVSVTEATGPNTVAVLAPVTSGNLLVVMTGHPGGQECIGGTPASYSDTRSLTFTPRVTSENVNGGQSNSCILTAPVTSSGAETITRTASLGNYPVAMWVIEIGGINTPAIDSVNGDTADFGTSVNSGNVTSSNTNLVLLGAASDNVANVFDSVSPSGGTSVFVSYTGAFMAKFVGAGTYSCTFGKTGGGGRYSCAALLLSFNVTASGSVQPSIFVIT